MHRSKIAIFTRNGLIGNIALNKAIPEMIAMGYEPVLFNTGEPYSKKADIPELREIGFLETALLRDTIAPFAKEYGSLTHGGRPIPNLCYTNGELASIYGLDYETIEDVNDPSFVERIAADKDFLGSYSVRILQIFHEPLLAAFEERQGGFVWNMHTGLLPKYKGVHIPYHAIENGERIYGWTLHKKFRDIDTGHILAVDWLPLNYKASVLSTYLNMVPKGSKMFATALRAYKKNGTIDEKAQPLAMTSSYYSHPTSMQMARHKINGVHFATDEEIIATYLKNYSLIGTKHYTELEQHIRAALSAQEEKLQAQS